MQEQEELMVERQPQEVPQVVLQPLMMVPQPQPQPQPPQPQLQVVMMMMMTPQPQLQEVHLNHLPQGNHQCQIHKI